MFTLGADPELFLVDAAGAYIAACGLIGGSKQQPLPLPIGDGFAVQEDNVAVEYNIPPAASKENFKTNIHRAMSFLTDMVQQRGLAFASTSAVSFPEEQLMHPLAQEFGCDPDFNAWTRKRNPRPAADDKTLRTCGGHVHIGYKFGNPDEALEFVKYADLYLGVPSIIMDNGERRKLLYGKRGAFRLKPYGVEYRSLSNFWVVNDKADWVWESVDMAMNAWQNKKHDMSELDAHIFEAINNNNKVVAQSLISQHNLLLA